MKPDRSVRPCRRLSPRLGLEMLEDRLAPAANLLVSVDGSASQQFLKEYTQQGTLVQSLAIPPGGAQEDARDVVAGADGRIHVYNGTSAPYLSTYDPAAATWGHRTHTGWSTLSSYGGIGIYQDSVFVTDYFTSGNASTERGIVRFNLTDGTASRFATDFNTQDLSIGGDGLLYAMGAFNTIRAYNPQTLALVRTVTLPSSVGGSSQFYTGLTVHANGDIYACTSSNRMVHRFNADGVVQASVTVSDNGTSIGWLYDIDLSADGTQLAVGTNQGKVALMSSALTGQTWFATGASGTAYVAFGPDTGASPALSINDVTVTEGNAGTVTATFTVSLSSASSETVTVNWATADGTATASDYTATSGTLTFNPDETSKTVTVTVLGDTLTEGNETFSVSLSGAAGATIADGQGTGTITDDDAPPSLSINDISVTEGNSGTSTATFTVSLSAASSQTVTVNWATAAGSASAGLDFTQASGTLSFAPGEISKTVTVLVAGDTLDENNETFFVNLSGAAGATISDSQGVGTISDDDAAAAAVNDVTVTEGDSGSVNATFTVTLATASDHTINVMWSTANNTAVNGSDYTSASGILTFAPGETSKTLTVAVLGDVVSEPTETFFVNLTYATSGIADNQGVGTILDNDPPALTIGDVTVTEGNGGTVNANFTVSLSVASAQTVTVNWATADGTATASDYTAASGTLVFNPGETSKTVTVTILGDTTDEPNETFSVNLSGAAGATIADGQGIGTITDDDAAATLSVGDVSVTEGAGAAVFTVTLSAVSGWPVTVNYATNDFTADAGSDYTDVSGTLTFAPGETTKTVSVPVVNDSVQESDEAFFLNLSGATNAGYSDMQGRATIVNDDFLVLAINDVTVTEDDYGTVSATFTVTLSEPSSSSVSVSWATANGTAVADQQYFPGDYESRSFFVSFAPGETSKTLTVTVLGDVKFEPDETFFVNLSNPSGAVIGDGQGVCTIVDNDPYVLTVSAVTVSESAGEAVFTVNLSQPSTETVTVNYATSDLQTTAGADYTAVSGTLTFAPGETTKTVSVPIINDTTDETSQEDFYFDLTGAVNAKPGFVRVTGRIQDDDNAPVVSISDTSVTEGDGGVVYAVFTVTLSNPSAQEVDLFWLAANDTAYSIWDYAYSGGSLSFAPGQTSKTISIPVYSDLETEPDETFFVNLSAPTNATLGDGQGVATILTDDFPPVANAGPDQTADEGVAVAFNAGGSSDPDGDTLSYLWNFGDGTTGNGVNPTHAFADNGTYTVTLTVLDGHGGSATDTLTVTVNNLAPTAAVTGPAGGVRGQARAFTFSATDPGSADLAASFTYSIDWGDGTSQTVTGPAGDVQVEHLFTAVGDYTVSVTATDKDGGAGDVASLVVTIVAVELQGDDLVVGGTTGADTITLTRVGAGSVRATVNGQNLGVFAVAGTVVAYGQAGDDVIELVGTNFPCPALLFGDAGNDTLDAQASGAGAVLVGGAGDDLLLGGSGRDLLLGGLGADTLQGGGNDDVVIGGVTDHDVNHIALAALLAEWARVDADLATRIAHLDGSESGGLNGSYLLNATTVHDDGATDELFGEGGTDWFIYAGSVSNSDNVNDWEEGDVTHVL